MHGHEREILPVLERQGTQLRLNPLASWDEDKVDAYFERFKLPRHPLSAQGYPSVGCAPCTAPRGSAGPRSGPLGGTDENGVRNPPRPANYGKVGDLCLRTRRSWRIAALLI